MTDVSDEYARAMDETPMSSDEYATALIAEAARLIDRSIRHLPHGVSSNESLKLVELIVEAAVERMRPAVLALLDSAVLASHPMYVTDGKTLKPVKTPE